MTRYPSLAPLNAAIPAADGLVLHGRLTYPHGEVGSLYPLAVLAHQYPSTHGSFMPFLEDLHALGIATMAFDMRGQGKSIWTPTGAKVAPTPAEPNMEAFGAAFVASASAIGFSHIADDIVRMAAWGMFQSFIDPTRLILVGSSVGGTGVLLAAPKLTKALRAVVTICAAGAPVHSPDAMERIRANCTSITTPMLLMSSEKDPFDGANNVRTWSKGLKHITPRIIPGAEHGMGIYYEVRRELIAFVKKTVAPSRRARPVRSR
jgi:pimeloyl-ACP methyl ester carboxylesterase